MIELIKNMSLENKSWIDIDTYVCKNDYETTRLASGGLLNICKDVLNNKLKNGFALIRPPGHHATKNRSMGFCLFNNAAIAANEIAKLGKKVLIFDWDVHHGNGTQDIFYDKKDVMYQSFHLSPHYPGTGDIYEIGKDVGKGYTINVPLCQGNGDNAVSKILDEIFLPVAKQFKPDFIIISAGFDSHHSDPLGGLKLTSNIYGEITSKLQKIQKKIVGTLEGGYSLNWIGKCLVSHLGILTDNPVEFKDQTKEKECVKYQINDIKKELETYWKI
jgi:acetoin utilization deacetylase AcuC-like enzyme